MKKLRIIILMLFTVILLSMTAFASLDNVPSLEVSLVSQDPDPAIAGDVLEVRVAVANLGSASANNVNVEFEPSYPFSLLSGESAVQQISTILGKQGVYDDNTKIIKFKVRVDKDAIAGEYDFKVAIYDEITYGKIINNLAIDVENKESAEIISIDQIELIPGKITPLKFTINNVGSSPLRDLRFSWENANDVILPVGSDNTKYIKYLNVGDNVDLEFDVIASAIVDPDLYKLDLVLTYDDSITGEEKTIQTKAGVYVGGATDFDAAYSSNSNGEYSFAISNIGSVAASSVTVKIPQQSSWKTTGTNSVIIGNLNEGDYTIASFNLQSTSRSNVIVVGDDSQNIARPGARTNNSMDYNRSQITGNSPVKLEIIYTDSRGNRNIIEKEVEIESSTSSSNSTGIANFSGNRMGTRTSPLTALWNTGRWILLGLILLIVFLRIRRRYKNEILDNDGYTYAKATKDTVMFWKNKNKGKSKK